MMKSCVILLLLCTAVIIRASDELTLEIESDELMKTGDLDLEQAETKDASATEIIKQIRKVNADGTYTIGFEADDGTFKIETRDSQGNVKQGTYGYVDEHGEVKRVLYSTDNSTLHKESKPAESSEQKEEENESISLSPSTRYNRTFGSTTRRPSSLAFLTSTAGSTNKPSVIQNIPKRRILLPSERLTSRSQSDTSKQSFEGTTTVVYATSVPTPKPYSSRSTTSPSYAAKASERSDKVEIDQVERKVYISTAKDVMTMKPILSKDKSSEKADPTKRGNTLRRQLKQDDEGKFQETQEAQQQVLYGSGDETSSIYGGGGYGNVRPLFTTTSQPRVPFQVLAARQRATQLQNVLANSAPSSTTERTFVKPPKRQNLQKVKVEEATESLNENFLTQPPQANVEQATELTEAGAADEQRRPFQRPLPPQIEGLYRPRNYLRQLQQQQLQLQQQQEFQQQPQDPRLAYRIPPNAAGPDPTDLRQPATPAAQRFVQQYQQPQGQQEQPAESFGNPLFPPRSGYDLDRPLTVRDFERLLQVLVFRQQQPSYRVNPYYPPSNPASYPPFIPGYNQPYSQIPRPPFFNPVTSGLFDPSYQNPYYSPSAPVGQQYPGGGPGPNQGDGMFQQAQQNPQQQIVDPNFDLQRLNPRRRQYDPRLFGQQTQVQSPPISPSEQEINYNALQPQGDNFLPPSVREQLLYRMLMLAIRGDQQYSPSSTAASTAAASTVDAHSVFEPEQQEANTVTTRTSTVSSKKPVRSVQILGEEDD